MADQRPLYFWRETSEHGYMSQWYPSVFADDKNPSVTYQTAEHYMMYQKAILFGDHLIAAQVLEAPQPRTVKALGRKVKSFTEAAWNANRERIVLQANLFKFRADPDLKKKLLATGDRLLAEASPYDAIWGIGLKQEYAERGRKGWGLNLLGKALMETRRILREEAEATG